MLAALAFVVALSLRNDHLARNEGMVLLACYPIFVALVILR
jgi:hypothetical protein